MVRPLTHANFLTSLADFYSSLCTIQEPTETQSATGHVKPSAWPALAGHIDLACRKAPAGANEPRRPNITYSVNTYTIALKGYYPLITTKMRVSMDSKYYNILGDPEHDDQHVTTRLTVELVA